MTIRRGEPWGEPVTMSTTVPITMPVAADDATAAQLIHAAMLAGVAVPEVVLAGGDLARTMGGGSPGRVAPGATLVRAPVDVIRLTTSDGREATALAHVVARAGRAPLSWWFGQVVVAMNAQFLGHFDVAPRSHPNDGRIDCVWVDPSMSRRQRLAARHRARTGTHLPHPALRSESVRSVHLESGSDLHLWLDGRWWGTAASVTLTAVPDAAVVLA